MKICCTQYLNINIAHLGCNKKFHFGFKKWLSWLKLNFFKSKLLTGNFPSLEYVRQHHFIWYEILNMLLQENFIHLNVERELIRIPCSIKEEWWSQWKETISFFYLFPGALYYGVVSPLLRFLLSIITIYHTRFLLLTWPTGLRMWHYLWFLVNIWVDNVLFGNIFNGHPWVILGLLVTSGRLWGSEVILCSLSQTNRLNDAGLIGILLEIITVH